METMLVAMHLANATCFRDDCVEILLLHVPQIYLLIFYLPFLSAYFDDDCW